MLPAGREELHWSQNQFVLLVRVQDIKDAFKSVSYLAFEKNLTSEDVLLNSSRYACCQTKLLQCGAHHGYPVLATFYCYIPFPIGNNTHDHFYSCTPENHLRQTEIRIAVDQNILISSCE